MAVISLNDQKLLRRLIKSEAVAKATSSIMVPPIVAVASDAVSHWRAKVTFSQRILKVWLGLVPVF